ncbi:MAG: YMGG-like glycine zipper-containing protein [Mesorhizobium sp.]|jgi:asparagine N-glycosylation enzyme membrane subunit Stt3
MRNLVLALVAVLALSGCTTTEQDVGVGTAAGAAIGGIAGGWKGAAIGAGAGALGGLLVRNLRNGYCDYRNPRTGHIYRRRCN